MASAAGPADTPPSATPPMHFCLSSSPPAVLSLAHSSHPAAPPRQGCGKKNPGSASPRTGLQRHATQWFVIRAGRVPSLVLSGKAPTTAAAVAAGAAPTMQALDDQVAHSGLACMHAMQQHYNVSRKIHTRCRKYFQGENIAAYVGRKAGRRTGGRVGGQAGRRRRSPDAVPPATPMKNGAVRWPRPGPR